MLESVNEVKATLASVGDSVAFATNANTVPTGATYTSAELPNVVDKFEISSTLLQDVSNFQNLSVEEALSVLQAENAKDIPSLTISDTYANLTNADASSLGLGYSSVSVESIITNPISVPGETFNIKSIHVEDVVLTEAINISENYLDYSYSFKETSSGTADENWFQNGNFENLTIKEAQALVGADNFSGTSHLTILDSATNILAAINSGTANFALFAAESQ